MADEITSQSRPVVTYSQAKTLGLAHYYTGKPCKHGHVAERLTINGSCCECVRLKQARWRAAHSELAREKYRDWKTRNPEIAKAATLKWRARNPDKVKKYAGDAYRRHYVKRTAAQRAYSAKHRGKIVTRVNAWQAANPENVKRNRRNWNEHHPEQVRANISVQAARRRNAEGRFSADDIARIHKAQKGKCAYCHKILKDKFHIDHIVALINGGTNWPANLQLCCEGCNSRKSAKDPLAFAQSLGRLL